VTRAGQRLTVVDGDTLELDGRVFDLTGIDAPELGQGCSHGGAIWHCGLAAALALHKFIIVSTDPVVCRAVDDEAPGRHGPLRCNIDTTDLSHFMVYSGYAVAGPEADELLRLAQKEAQNPELGIWGSEFVPPDEWRQGRRLDGEEEPCSYPDEVIGIVGEDGAREYFVPTDERFEEIRDAAAEGASRFCSDEEARAAGWRRPGERRADD
jgi:endonuclease YncB( thermonuclease family)